MYHRMVATAFITGIKTTTTTAATVIKGVVINKVHPIRRGVVTTAAAATTIRQIDPSQTWPVRHRVMWPSKPFDYVKVAEDEIDDDSVRHYGLFVHNYGNGGYDAIDDGDTDRDQPVSVVSVFLTPMTSPSTTTSLAPVEAQFRKFATETHHQGKGYGTQLLTHMFETLSASQQRGEEPEGWENSDLGRDVVAAPVAAVVKRVWCNARTDKAEFYRRRFGMVETNTTFTRDGQSYVIMEKWI
jgi:GNAT superfamily N-acetyltransferase